MARDHSATRLDDDPALIAALRDGDERAFVHVVDTYSPLLLRVAMAYVPSRAVAEEVVQETWLGVLKGVDRFEGRSSLKTWIFRILANVARTRGARENRSVPFSSLASTEAAATADPERFLTQDHDRSADAWALGPATWPTPERALLASETRGVILSAVERLTPAQRTVVVLREIEGWPSAEVCAALEISAANQRVLLHRGRRKVRAALENHFGDLLGVTA